MPLPAASSATNTMPPPETEHAPELRLMRIRLLLVVGATEERAPARLEHGEASDADEAAPADVLEHVQETEVATRR